jgi:hypothetical protein
VSNIIGLSVAPMRLLLKLVAGLVVLLVVLTIYAAFVYPTTHGYMRWWFRSNASLSIDGVHNGYVHTNSDHSAIIITRTDSSPRQSYLVTLSDHRFVIHCGEWHAPHLIAFPIGHVNPPCSVFRNGEDMPSADNPMSSTLVLRPRFVEFKTAHGKTVSASW